MRALMRTLSAAVVLRGPPRGQQRGPAMGSLARTSSAPAALLTARERFSAAAVPSGRAMGGRQAGPRASAGEVEQATAAEATPLPKLPGLRAEAARQSLRAAKKAGKARERLRRAEESGDVERACEAEADFERLRERVQALAALEAGLAEVRSAKAPAFAALAAEAAALGVSDQKPQQQPRGPKKPKGERPRPRLPYHTYVSSDGLHIRVGRQAEDNDELSCNPEHRDADDWWMHASGYPGSHVVVRSHDALPPATKREAALLAVKYSKGRPSGKQPVSVVRCRQVSKPVGAKAGLVRLSGDVETVAVDCKRDRELLDRILTSKL
mmetsp:Transcript_22405/g.72724  ORF Transcript_22405/g.72724 Transcript_22405/m.72724 type:complete len:325 (-) Transcript_22405:5381-6355(-)